MADPDEPRSADERAESQAGMAELADAADSKSADPCGRGGSTPPPGTNKIKSLYFSLVAVRYGEFVRSESWG